MIDLSPRLRLAAQRCRGADSVIDVGCDHGYLSIYMAANMGVKQVKAADISAGPLNNARKNIEKYGLLQKISLTMCDGLQAFEPQDCDTIVICGMGGELICHILDRAKWAMDGAHKLILQPMTKPAILRKYLFNKDCGITFEGLAQEDRMLYCVMEARGGQPVMGEKQSFIFTEKMVDDPRFKAFTEVQKAKVQKIIEGKQRAKQDCTADENILKMLEEYSREAM